MKKKSVWIVLGVIILIIPTIVAIVNYVITKDSPISSGSVTQITLQLPHDGEEKEPETFVFEPVGSKVDLNNIGTNMLGYFTEVTSQSKEVSELPEKLKGIPHYSVVFTNYNRPVEYKFYFTDQPEFCYFTDANEKCYNIPEEHAKAFLLSVYGMSVFDTAEIPVASTPSVEFIDPVSVSWSYLTIDNLYPTYTEKDDKAYTDTVYIFAEKLSLTYTNCPGDPATQSVEVLDETGSSIYSGSIAEMEFAEIPKNQVIDVQLTATWSRTEEKACEGTLVYRFKCKITDSPVFTVTTKGEKAEAGYFFAAKAENVISDPSKIKITFEPEIDTNPIFYDDGNVDRALIILPHDIDAGTYTVTFSADGVESSHTLEVEEFEYRSTTVKKENIASTVLTAESEAEFETNMKEILTAKSEQRYFEGGFIYPIAGSKVNSGYGLTLKTDGGYEYVNKWVRVSSGIGKNVLAMNAGKVVYVGEQTMSGKTVVIDHGLGLMSIYANFGEISVSVGDTVKTGDVIGTSGTTGYSDGTRFSVALTVNGEYVCPYQIWDDEGIVLE